MSFLALRLGHPHQTIPATQTVAFGAKTRVGSGGSPISYSGIAALSIVGGNSSNHWQIDARNMLVPKNGAGAYGTAGPTFSGPYVLTITDGTFVSDVTVNITANAAHIREMASVADGGTTTVNADTTSSFQLKTLLSLAQASAGALVLGDTVVGRDGQMNPKAQGYTIAPPLNLYAAGSGPRITVTSETIDLTNDANGNPNLMNGFQIGKLLFASSISGDVAFPIDFSYVWWYINDNTTTAGPFFDYSTSGSNVGFYYSRSSFGPAVLGPTNYSHLLLNANSTVQGCHFIGGGFVIRGGNTMTVLDNVCEDNAGDFINFSTNTGGHTVLRNFMFNVKYVSPNHTDYCQHLGVKNNTSIVYGTFQYNLAIRNVGNPSLTDAQFFFADDTTGTGRVADAQILNNISFLTTAAGVAMTKLSNPVVQQNTILMALGTNAAAPVSNQIECSNAAFGGEGGTITRNLTNIINMSGQGGVVTIDKNTLCPLRTTPEYTAALPNYVGGANPGITNRALLIAMATPLLNGTAKQSDGTYAGALFPVDNAGHVGWNDGTVFSAADTHTQAT